MKSQFTTYLCGGINGLNDADAKNWRELAKQKLNTETLDPMRRDYRGKEAHFVEEIVRGDLDDISNSDFILVNASKPSWGTAMEIVYAFTTPQVQRIVAIADTKTVSPWLRYHCNAIYDTLEQAIADINFTSIKYENA